LKDPLDLAPALRRHRFLRARGATRISPGPSRA
jgi:hypothetical protein